MTQTFRSLGSSGCQMPDTFIRKMEKLRDDLEALVMMNLKREREILAITSDGDDP